MKRMRIHRDRIVETVVMALLLSVLFTGCGTEVHEVPVSNRPADGQADLTGLSQEKIDYFRDKYPPDSWAVKPSANRVAVAPVLFSQEVLHSLDPDEPKTGRVKTTVAIVTDSGTLDFSILERYSPEMRAILIEAITASKAYRVHVLDDVVGLDIYRGQISVSTLAEQDIPYLLQATLAGNKGDDGGFRAYLRFIDTDTQAVICAVSGSGKDLKKAALEASKDLMKQISTTK